MTNGVLSIVRDGTVLAKIVAGCDGYNVPKLAEKLRGDDLPPENILARVLYDMALADGVGCEDCLVVQTPAETIYQGEGELPARYKEKFADPKFNPRWKRGLAAYTEMVEIPD